MSPEDMSPLHHSPAPAAKLGVGEPIISKSFSHVGRGIEGEGKRDMHPVTIPVTINVVT